MTQCGHAAHFFFSTTANAAFARLQQQISLVGTWELRSEWLSGGRIQRQVWITGGTEIKVPPFPTSHEKHFEEHAYWHC